MQFKKIIDSELFDHQNVLRKVIEQLSGDIEAATILILDSLKKGGKVIIFGNGGSASDAQHFAGELIGRYKNNRPSLAAISLNTDTSVLTCIANDFGYEDIFSRQIESLANQNDIAIGISTGGTSKNVINGLLSAKNRKCKTIGFSGKGGGSFEEICDLNIIAPSSSTARIQEVHIVIIHLICEILEEEFS